MKKLNLILVSFLSIIYFLNINFSFSSELSLISGKAIIVFASIAKIKAASTGRKHSKKTKINMSKKQKGKKKESQNRKRKIKTIIVIIIIIIIIIKLNISRRI